MKCILLQIFLTAFLLVLIKCENFEPENNLKEFYFDALEQNPFLLGGNELESSDDNENGISNKRTERYSFGLGRRSAPNPKENMLERPKIWLKHSGQPQNYFGIAGDKRGRPYNFGLGKRVNLESEMVQRRTPSHRWYNFGLGKR